MVTSSNEQAERIAALEAELAAKTMAQDGMVAELEQSDEQLRRAEAERDGAKREARENWIEWQEENTALRAALTTLADAAEEHSTGDLSYSKLLAAIAAARALVGGGK